MELALKRAAGRPELAAELHTMLISSCSEIKPLLEQCWDRGDRQTLLTHVHKLNGSTRYCGVPELESCAEELELLLKRGGDEVAVGYEDLMRALERIVAQPAQFTD